MDKWTRKCLVLVVGLSLTLPATAFALNLNDNANSICLASLGGANAWCYAGGSPNSLGSDMTIYLRGGDDILQVSGAPGCNCDCGAANENFVYGGNTLTVYGGDGDDVIYGADGQNFLAGDAGADELRAGSHNSDTLAGAAGADTIVDAAGTSETLYGGDDADEIRDIGCSYTSISCGNSTLDKCACGGPTTYCGNADCENSLGAIDIACPGL